MAKVTVSANGKSIVHKGSGGNAMATIPDVCITPFPPPTGPIPLPYPNFMKSDKVDMGSILTKIDGESAALAGSIISESTGDEVGSQGGIVSGSTKGKGSFLKWSPNVKIEGRPVCRKGDMMTCNTINTLSISGMDQEDVPDPTAISYEEEIETIEIEFVDDEGIPHANEAYIIKMLDGSEIKGQLDDKGYAKVENVPAGYYKIQFPDLDPDLIINKLPEDSES